MTDSFLNYKAIKPPQDWQIMFKKWAQEAPEGPLKDYYQAGMISAETPLQEAPLLALDLETTGLDPQQDDIISLGIIPFDPSLIRCRGANYWITKPEQALDAKSVTIHAITDSELSKAPPLNAILDSVLKALTRQVIVVHCVAIERQFLRQASLQIYGYPLYFPVLDTMEIERQVHHKPWWQRFGRPPSLRLDASRQRYHLPRYKAHHALTDALSSAELLQAQIAYHLDPNGKISNYWV